MGIEVKEIKKIRKYKAGYEVREEMWHLEGCGCGDTPMKSAYNPSGDYIGSPKDAHYLCKKRGIKPEKAKDNHCVCSIGFNEEKQTWTGWSHRAIYGFGIGSKVQKGDCGYFPNNYDELLSDLKNDFLEEIPKQDNVVYKTSHYQNVLFEETPEKDGIIVRFEHQVYNYVPHDEKACSSSDDTCNCHGPVAECCGCVPEAITGVMEKEELIYKYGRGEWTAETLEDAKQMAIEFAESVS